MLTYHTLMEGLNMIEPRSLMQFTEAVAQVREQITRVLLERLIVHRRVPHLRQVSPSYQKTGWL